MKINLNELIKKPEEFYISLDTKIKIEFNKDTNEIIIDESTDPTYALLKKCASYPSKQALVYDLIRETSPIIKEHNNKIQKIQNENGIEGKTLKINDNEIKQWVNDKRKYDEFPYVLQELALKEYENLTIEQAKNLIESGLLSKIEYDFIEKKYNVYNWEKYTYK